MEVEQARSLRTVGVIAASVSLLVLGLSLLSNGGEAHEDRETPERVDDPSGAEVRRALQSLGGIDTLVQASATGAFDVVTFDPDDHDVLLASNRASYGEAENHFVNERWIVTQQGLSQELSAPEQPHDFAHFNRDGTLTRWIHGGGPDFAPRVAQLLDRSGRVILETQPMYASRFVVDNDRVFALLGDGVYGSDAPHGDLIVDDGQSTRTLADGAPFSFIDSPAAGLLVAYPTNRSGATRVWNTETLDEVAGHALAGKPYIRTAINADTSIALGATFDGHIDVIDLRTDQVTHSFGEFVVDGVDHALTLSSDGSIAVVVQPNGMVEIWWVDDATRLASIAGDAAQPRWLSETYASRSTTAVSNDATRLAVRRPARPGVSTSWEIVDLDINRWLADAQRQ